MVNMYNVYKYAPKIKIQGRGGGNCRYETNRSQFNRKHNPNSIKISANGLWCKWHLHPHKYGMSVKMGFESPQVRKYIN